MQHFSDTFMLAPEPQQQTQQLIERDDEFTHLRRHSIGCLFSQRTLTDRGALARAIVSVPAQVTSKAHERQLLEWCYAELFRPLYSGALPDFVVYFDMALWQRDSPLEREQLCYHELCHLQQRRDDYGAPKFEKSGRPAVHLVPHDVEVFHSELRRYGDVVPGFDDAAVAIADGVKRQRRLRLA